MAPKEALVVSMEPGRNECIGGHVHAYERRTEASR